MTSGEQEPLALEWTHASPGVLVGLLVDMGAVVRRVGADEWKLDIGGATLTVRCGSPSESGLTLPRLMLARLTSADAALAAAPTPPDSPAARMRLAALGLASVDAERTAKALGISAADAVAEPALGARGWISRPARARPRVAVLEPAREGRLAAALARFGEGPAVLYVVPTTPPGTWPSVTLATARPTAAGVPGRLIRPDRPWGPFLIVLAPATSAPGGASRPAAAGRRPEAAG